MALVGGALVVAASPAQAAPPTVDITDLAPTNIGPGDRTTLRYTISNANPDVPGQSDNVRIQVDGGGMNCGGDCSRTTQIRPGETREFTANLTAPGVDAGDTKSLQVQVTATLNNENASAAETVTVRGPEKPQQVRQISGKVRDTDGKAVSGAQVAMQDSADHRYETTTNGDGLYSFTSSDDKPISPGAVSIAAIKDGFKPASKNVQASAGKSVNAPLVLASNAVTPSPTPSATEEASAAPTDEATDEATTEAAGETAGTDTQQAANTEDEGSGSLLFIILGGLLVAAGVGAIVLVLMRRKADKGDDDDDLGGAAVPPMQGGRFGDETRVAAPVGGGRANDATMVASISGAPSLSDAPTMLQRPVPADDEFPDPYGAPPMPQQVTYGATAAGAYGAAPQYGGGAANAYGGAPAPAQSAGYDDDYAGPPTQYGRPVPQDDPYGAYAQDQGGYGAAAAPRYDEPTGMYSPAQDYDQGGYHAGADQGGYGQEPEYPQAGRARPEPTGAGGYQGGTYGQAPADQGGYGAWGDAGTGIDSGNAYGPAAGGAGYGAAPAPAPGGTYGAPAGGGYDAPPARGGTYGGGAAAGYPQQQAGYEQGGYEQPGTYGRPDAAGYDRGAPAPQGGYPPQQQGGYDQPGYGDQGGYDPRQYGGADPYAGEQGGGRHGSTAARPQDYPPRRPAEWRED